MNNEQLEYLRDALVNFASATASKDAARHANNLLHFIAGETRPWSPATLSGHTTVGYFADHSD